MLSFKHKFFIFLKIDSALSYNCEIKNFGTYYFLKMFY